MLRAMMAAALLAALAVPAPAQMNRNRENLWWAFTTHEILTQRCHRSVIAPEEAVGYTRALARIVEDAERREPQLDARFVEQAALAAHYRDSLMAQDLPTHPSLCYAMRVQMARIWWERFPDRCALLCGCTIPPASGDGYSRADTERFSREGKLPVGLPGHAPNLEDLIEIADCGMAASNPGHGNAKEAIAACERKRAEQQERKRTCR